MSSMVPKFLLRIGLHSASGTVRCASNVHFLSPMLYLFRTQVFASKLRRWNVGKSLSLDKVAKRRVSDYLARFFFCLEPIISCWIVVHSRCREVLVDWQVPRWQRRAELVLNPVTDLGQVAPRAIGGIVI